MKDDNLIKDLSYDFALSVVRTYKILSTQEHEYILSKQFLRSGTSIGANIKEAIRGQSRADFGSKMNIALKETSETEYWIELLRDSDYLSPDIAEKLLDDCHRIIRVLTAIVKSTFNGKQS